MLSKLLTTIRSPLGALDLKIYWISAARSYTGAFPVIGQICTKIPTRIICMCGILPTELIRDAPMPALISPFDKNGENFSQSPQETNLECFPVLLQNYSSQETDHPSLRAHDNQVFQVSPNSWTLACKGSFLSLVLAEYLSLAVPESHHHHHHHHHHQIRAASPRLTFKCHAASPRSQNLCGDCMLLYCLIGFGVIKGS
jgi:hypothetical protein